MKRSIASTESLFKHVIGYFEIAMPIAESELHYKDPYELLVAVILSAQCTDKRVNMVTPLFFQQFPNPQVLATASSDEVFEWIKSISYPNNKARHLVGMAQKLVKEFHGVVPDSVDELQKLPGVGRKTANVIASVIYNKPAMAVDTHVFRVSARIGLTKNAKTPLETEKQLIKHIPQELIPKAHHWLILHGRYVCTARNPKCHECGLSSVCSYLLDKTSIQNEHPKPIKRSQNKIKDQSIMSTLKIGEKAPLFSGIDQNGITVNLNDFKDCKVILYFYPKDDTPGCTAEACNLRDNYDVLIEKGYKVIGISPDNLDRHTKFATKYKLPFSILPDPDKEIILKYHVWGEKKFLGKNYMGVLRTTFVIDESGLIEEMITKVDTKNHAAQILNQSN